MKTLHEINNLNNTIDDFIMSVIDFKNRLYYWKYYEGEDNNEPSMEKQDS